VNVSNSGYGLVEGVQNPNGSWEKYHYPNKEDVDPLAIPQIDYELHAWKDVTYAAATASNCRRIAILPSGSGQVETIEGYEVRRWTDEGGTRRDFFTPGENGAYLESRRLRVASGEFAGRLESTRAAAGRMTTYAYERGQWNAAQGTFNPSGTPLDAIRTTVTTGRYDVNTGGLADVANKSNREVSIEYDHRTVKEESYAYVNGAYSLTSTTRHFYDSAGHLEHTMVDGRTVSQSSTTTDGRLQWTEDAAGIRTEFTYDSRNRVQTETRKGTGTQADLVTAYVYDADGRVKEVVHTEGGLSESTSTVYRFDGRVESTTDSRGLTTSMQYIPMELSADGLSVVTSRQVVTTLPGGGTEESVYFLDGQIKNRKLKRETGTLIHETQYGYAVASGFQTATESVVTPTPSTYPTRTTVRQIDMLGRVTQEQTPGPNGNTITRQFAYHATTGLLTQVSQAGLPDRIYGYDELGNSTIQGLVSLDPAVGYGVTTSETVFAIRQAKVFEKSFQETYSDATTKISGGTSWRQLSGLAVNQLSYAEFVDGFDQTTTTNVTVDRATKTVTTTTDDPVSQINQVTIAINGLTKSTAGPAIGQILYDYDGLGRGIKTTDARGYQQLTAYYPAAAVAGSRGQVQMITAFHTASNPTPPTTAFTYQGQSALGAGQVHTTTLPEGQTVVTTYDSQGQLKTQSGTGTYPLEMFRAELRLCEIAGLAS
jgi:YD repeat-containing protein